MIGVDKDNSAVIIENKNEPVDEGILASNHAICGLG